MDAERLSTWKTRVIQFNDGSDLTAWKDLFQGFVDLYKDELAETITGLGTGQSLTNARVAIQSAADTFKAAMTTQTSAIKK